jgi:hypothetical protein
MVSATVPVPGPLRKRAWNIPITGRPGLLAADGGKNNGQNDRQVRHQTPPAHGGYAPYGPLEKQKGFS